MNKENCALKLVDEIILYYDVRSKKHKKISKFVKRKHHNITIYVHCTPRFITEMCVYCAVRADSLNVIEVNLSP